jgi:hypothetical protein
MKGAEHLTQNFVEQPVVLQTTLLHPPEYQNGNLHVGHCATISLGAFAASIKAISF